MSSENRFCIVGIDRVKFGVTHMADARRFLIDWGLRPAHGDADAATLYRARDGSEVELAPSGDGVDPPLGGPDGMLELTWGVTDPAALRRLARELERDRAATFDAEGVLHTVDDLGIGLAFRPTHRHPVPYEPTRYNSPGRPDRIDRRAARYERADPFEISHLAVGVDDAGAAVGFYIERLGFVVSDRYADRGVFLRCAPTGNHHHVFFMNSKIAGTRLNHLAFKVRDVHEMIGGGQYIDDRGWKTFAGPGRHIVSSACFWYFHAPLGCAFEYAADEDVVTPDWETTDFAASAHIFTEWRFGLEKGDGTLKGPISFSKAQSLDRPAGRHEHEIVQP